MGYRHYFYLVDKSKCEAIRNMTMSKLCNYAKSEGVEGGDGWFSFNDNKFLDKKEIFEFGKLYWDDTADRIYSKGEPLFTDKEVQEDVSDYDPYVVGKPGVLEAIEIYKRKIIEAYKNLLVDGGKQFLPGGFYIERDDIKSIDKIRDFIHERLKWWERLGAIDLDETHESISDSYQYEHQIFELVRLYKSIDWETKTVLFYGW
nr:MAG TPA: hypothetical protein [Caudoviricetes sp.]